MFLLRRACVTLRHLSGAAAPGPGPAMGPQPLRIILFHEINMIAVCAGAAAAGRIWPGRGRESGCRRGFPAAKITD
jgi:hypothetical protein